MERVRNQHGRKTREQFLRIVERKDDVPKKTETERIESSVGKASRTPRRKEARQSDTPVSRGGMHQESRDHNKHNDPGQSGHKPKKHSLAEQKH